MFYIVYRKTDFVVLFYKEDFSTGLVNTPDEILTTICNDRQVSKDEYTIEETVKLLDICVDGSQVYDPSTKTLAVNPAYIAPPAVETSSIPVSDPGAAQ